jgi:uncharacterized membrane protein YqjE
MKPIPLKKRLLCYLALLPIGLVMTFLFAMIAIAIGDNRAYAGISVPIVFFVFHFIFGVIFLKTKLVYKIIVPIITALFSGGILYGILFLMTKYDFKTRILDYYGFFDMIVLMFLVIILVWEIAYQIVKIIANHNNQINHSSDKE